MKMMKWIRDALPSAEMAASGTWKEELNQFHRHFGHPIGRTKFHQKPQKTGNGPPLQLALASPPGQGPLCPFAEP
jgi:hypothetical protein